MPITISVLIPAYNAENFIIEALDSIAHQLRRPEEIIVVDDGSKDSTALLVRQWSSNKEFVVNLIQQENKGLPAARNRGISASSCDWIALLDADDLFLPNHLAEMEQAVSYQPEVVAVFGDCILFGHTDINSEPFSHKKATLAASLINNGVYILGEKLYSSIIHGNYIKPCCFVFKRSMAIEIGMFDESMKFIEDRDFMLRLSRKGNFGFVDRVTAKARLHENNITHPKNAMRNTYFVLRVLKKALDHAKEMKLSAGELQLTKMAIHQTTNELLYLSSIDSFKSYIAAMHHLIGMPFTFSKINPRHFLRAIYYNFWKNRKNSY
ncbi:MAG: glycosyltransferase family 2 protein [Candidatus Competibacteraceae bacterium]|nr:glycosyltransferase family 2 protein [Candidatus Competibacteraceae bacterium]